jgi:hypothetical protein
MAQNYGQSISGQSMVFFWPYFTAVTQIMAISLANWYEPHPRLEKEVGEAEVQSLCTGTLVAGI